MRGGLIAASLLALVALAAVSAATAATPQVIHYVSLGDSVTTVTPSFVGMVAKSAHTKLHRKVTASNFVEDGDVSALVGRVKTDPELKATLRSADLITITIGANEIGASLDRIANKTCGGGGGLACVRTAERRFERSYRALLDQLTLLRSHKEAAYRLLTSFDTPSVFPADLGKPFAAALRAENAFVCAQALARAMKCADVYAAFNGTDGSQDPLSAGLIIQDGHPSAKGSATIASVVVDLGFAPLH